MATRPAKPRPVCETCGADVWWAWHLHGKYWTALAPERQPVESTSGMRELWGSFEVWQDSHGGLLCRHLEPGARGVQDRSWRGQLHSLHCGQWAEQTATALSREVAAAVPAMSTSALLVFGRRLVELQEQLNTEHAKRVDERTTA